LILLQPSSHFAHLLGGQALDGGFDFGDRGHADTLLLGGLSGKASFLSNRAG
jgi:hypothetical protein